MKYILQSKPLLVLVRILVGGVLIYASIDKIINPDEFARSVANYHMLPFGLENTVAIILPWLELIVGIALIIGVYLDGASFITMGMMIFFIIAISTAILRGYNIDCGCGLREGEVVGINKIIEDVLYLCCSLIVYFRKIKYLEIR